MTTRKAEPGDSDAIRQIFNEMTTLADWCLEGRPTWDQRKTDKFLKGLPVIVHLNSRGEVDGFCGYTWKTVEFPHSRGGPIGIKYDWLTEPVVEVVAELIVRVLELLKAEGRTTLRIDLPAFLQRTPHLSWLWKVGGVVEATHINVKTGDDSSYSLQFDIQKGLDKIAQLKAAGQL